MKSEKNTPTITLVDSKYAQSPTLECILHNLWYSAQQRLKSVFKCKQQTICWAIPSDYEGRYKKYLEEWLNCVHVRILLVLVNFELPFIYFIKWNKHVAPSWVQRIIIEFIKLTEHHALYLLKRQTFRTYEIGLYKQKYVI